MDCLNNKIRVCFVSPKAYPIFNPDVESVFGGAEVDLYMIGTELAKDSDFEVSFIVADYGQPDKEVREGVSILKSVNFKQNPITGAVRIWKALKQTNADAYMLKTASPGVPLVRYFCQKYDRRFMYKTANPGECDGSYVRSHPILGRFFVHSLKTSAQVITQNQRDKETLKTTFNINSILLPNGHRIPVNTPSDKNSILWIGRSAKVKGPGRFIELAKSIPNESFVMICQRATGDTQYDQLKASAAAVENLEFIERVPFHEVDSYFERAKVFVNTSDSEGFPNTFIQACKVGTAILSYVVNPDGFLDKHQCGVCCGGDQQRMVKQLGETLNESQYQHFGSNGLAYVKKHHNITTIIEQYKTLFRSAAKPTT